MTCLKYLSVRACVLEKLVNRVTLAGVCMIRVVAETYYCSDFI